MDSQRTARIFDSGCRAAFAVTGGGSGALHALLSTPGASRFVADVRIPYSAEALAGFLGKVPEQAVSPATAAALASKSVESALRADLRSESAHYMGVSCSAALATDRERRGDDRAFICIKTADAEKTYALYFSKAPRAEQEALLSEWLLVLIAQAVGAERGLMLPGSFNPLHKGHIGMLAAAEQITGLRGVFELSAANVDKPDIPEDDILRRVSSIRDIPVALTRAPRFVQKAELFPNTTFVLGHDTAVRLIDYAEGDEWLRFQKSNASFLVAGRLEQSFKSLADLNLPAGFESLFEAIPESTFREDISSTELRENRKR